MCYIYIYIQRVDFRGFVTVRLARGNKSYGELSLGASGSRFFLSQRHVWEGFVLYIKRVDFRRFVTVVLARGKNSVDGTELRG